MTTKVDSKKLKSNAKLGAVFVISNVVAAYVGYAIPNLLKDREQIDYQIEFSNKPLPNKMRYSVPANNPFPIEYATAVSFKNSGNVDIYGERLKINFESPFSMCSIVPDSLKQVVGLTSDKSQKTLDEDPNANVAVEGYKNAVYTLGELNRGSIKRVLFVSNPLPANSGIVGG